MVSEYKLINEPLNKGVTLTEIDFLNILRFTYRNNKGLFEKLKQSYEHLEQKKFDFKLIGITKYKKL